MTRKPVMAYSSLVRRLADASPEQPVFLTFPVGGLILPDFKARVSLTGNLFFHANRVSSGANAVTTGNKTRPVDAKPAGFKMAESSFCLTFPPTVVHPAITGNGSGWLPACPRNLKNAYAHPKGTFAQTQWTRLGLLCPHR